MLTPGGKTRSAITGLIGRAKRVVGSVSVQAALALGVGGIAFALASLLMARFMEPELFGLLILILALVQFGTGLGPLGVDLVVNRHRLPATRRLGARVVLTGALAAGLVCGIGELVYDIPTSYLALLFAIVIVSAANRVGAAFFQSAARFTGALALTQAQNFVFLATVPLALLAGDFSVEFVLRIVLAGYTLTALIGWLYARASLADRGQPVGETVLLKEGLGGLGIALAVLTMMMMERLLIPILLSLEAMATFAVLASVVGAPFRMMQLAIGFTLLPQLRRATSEAAAHQLIRSEIAIGVAICLGGTLLVLTIGPWAINLIVGDRYEIGLPLFVAAILAGYAKILQGTTLAIVNALGSPRVLALMGTAAWLSLVVAAALSWTLSGLGLQGIIYGVGGGWLMQALVALWLCRGAIRSRFQARSAEAPAPAATDLAL
jgi:O-antigen/teichoic acid export membrane protein